MYSQAIRYRRIINDDSILEEQLSKLSGYFTKCGYPEPMVKEIVDQVKIKPRILEYTVKSDDRPFHAPMLSQYGVGSEEVKTFINRDLNNNLMKAPIFADYDKPILRTVYTKAPSLRNMLYNQRDIVLDNHGGYSIRCTTVDESMHKRGRKCLTCNLMRNTNEVKVHGKVYSRLDGGDCKSNNVIYLAQCTACNKPYVGKTDTPLHKRVNGHRNPTTVMSTNRYEMQDAQALSIHASTMHNTVFDECYKFSIVENVQNPANLLYRENYYINKFNSKEPYRINIDNPLNVPILRFKV